MTHQFAAVRGFAYGSTFGGMRLRGVFWGSVEVFKENLKNWQGNFSKIATNFCEKRKYLGMAFLRGERPRVTSTSSHMNSRFCGKKSRKKLKCALARVISSRLSVNGLQSKLGACSRDGRQECL